MTVFGILCLHKGSCCVQGLKYDTPVIGGGRLCFLLSESNLLLVKDLVSRCSHLTRNLPFLSPTQVIKLSFKHQSGEQLPRKGSKDKPSSWEKLSTNFVLTNHCYVSLRIVSLILMPCKRILASRLPYA